MTVCYDAGKIVNELITDTSHPDFNPNVPELKIAEVLRWGVGPNSIITKSDIVENIARSEAATSLGITRKAIYDESHQEKLGTPVLGRVALVTSHGMRPEHIDKLVYGTGHLEVPETESILSHVARKNSVISKIIQSEIQPEKEAKAIQSVGYFRNIIRDLVRDDTERSAYRTLLNNEKHAALIIAAGFSPRQAAGILGVSENEVRYLLLNGLQNVDEAISGHIQPLYDQYIDGEQQKRGFYIDIAEQLYGEPGFTEWISQLDDPDKKLELIETAIKLGSVKNVAEKLDMKANTVQNAIEVTVRALDRARCGAYTNHIRPLRADYCREALLHPDGFAAVDLLNFENRITVVGLGLGFSFNELAQLGYTSINNRAKYIEMLFESAILNGSVANTNGALILSDLVRDLDTDQIVDLTGSLTPRQATVVVDSADGRYVINNGGNASNRQQINRTIPVVGDLLAA